ncbi:RNA polymerase recycling motor ATPase HelR [Agromyces flavus]|uniref:RNA polymerase recycling motor ATPase HelR n=1 Tax=Agromyces flavus TaxID=589382 RepID=UPI001E317B14|nr:RNA polymerase recycling motor ATPase HelR [Agromyces flavus]
MTVTAFALPDRLAHKADPALIADDERHFAAIAGRLDELAADVSGRLDDARRQRTGGGQSALDRDLEVHRLTARLRTLRRFGLDLCLGHIVDAQHHEPIYIGRFGLTDDSGRRLLVDWRSPAAEPFFAATHADPRGLVHRRRYRWTRGRVTDYWDEAFTEDELRGHAAALDDQSAFIASLGESRSARMRDVLGTIQADQDAIIRAGSRGALVVDGGPGTGKTVVALHRAAYLLYADPRLAHRRGGVLVVGPSVPYLDYVADVLPGLGEEGVRSCTLADLVPEGAGAVHETDPVVARLKSTVAMVATIDAAVAYHEQPPTEPITVETEWGGVDVEPEDWAEAFAAPEHGTPHDEARAEVWQELLRLICDRHDDVSPHLLQRALAQSVELTGAFRRAWPLLDPAGVVADLWSVPEYLRRCAPHLAPGEVDLLQRSHARAWTVSDLPLLDAARARIGDPDAAARRRRREAALADEREQREMVLEHLIAADDSEMAVMSMLRGQDVRAALTSADEDVRTEVDLLAGPFGHVVVDEAQELTDAEWLMLLRRSPSRSLTIVGDRAQARRGFAESWSERLACVGIDRVTIATLGINYRTPEEVMLAAEPIIRAALPDANVPTSIRRTGVPVSYASLDERDAILDAWLAEHEQGEGIACVIGDLTFTGSARIRSLTPRLAKGLEFDLVVLVDPDSFGSGVEGAVDRYVAMTRATGRLVVLSRD